MYFLIDHCSIVLVIHEYITVIIRKNRIFQNVRREIDVCDNNYENYYPKSTCCSHLISLSRSSIIYHLISSHLISPHLTASHRIKLTLTSESIFHINTYLTPHVISRYIPPHFTAHTHTRSPCPYFLLPFQHITLMDEIIETTYSAYRIRRGFSYFCEINLFGNIGSVDYHGVVGGTEGGEKGPQHPILVAPAPAGDSTE